jgi:hypothetical protein
VTNPAHIIKLEPQMSQHEVIVVFTAQSVDRILNKGGTSAWKLSRNHARQCAYALCTRNAKADWVEGLEDHRAGFLLGKVKDVVPAPGAKDGRLLVQFSEFALINLPGAWNGDRNPVSYSTLSELGIDPSTLKWQPMPESKEVEKTHESLQRAANTPLTLTDAKKGLALTFGVSPEAIEITIRA